jgi:hypothetical protein
MGRGYRVAEEVTDGGISLHSFVAVARGHKHRYDGASCPDFSLPQVFWAWC